MGDYGDAMMRDQNTALQARTKAQNRANVMQLKMMGQSHPTGLTTNLLKLFEPRPPLEYKPPSEKRKCLPYTDDPNKDPNITGDPYKTLFVARINYETSENRIKREFEAYGPIKRVRLVTNKDTNKPRGYAFIEFMHTRDMKAAYKQADDKKIDNRRVLVDVERGRTVPNWRPRRLGGGLGTSRVGGEEVNQRERGHSGGKPVSEEPRVRDERDREKSRERGRDKEKEREKSRELSHERARDRDRREDRHHRDRDRREDRHHRDHDRNRDRDKDRDHGLDREKDRPRDHDRGRDRGRDHDDRDREHGRDRNRDREREKDYEAEDGNDRGSSRDRAYDRVNSKHERDRGTRDRDNDNAGAENDRGWSSQPEREHGHYDYHERQGRGSYEDRDGQGDYDCYKETDRGDERYDHMDEDGYGNVHSASEPQERDYRR